MTTEIVNYAIAFLLTVVLEVAVALLFGYRKPAEIAAVFWVNVFSHPLVNFLIRIVGVLREAPVGPKELLLFECGVVLVEWQLLCYALPRRSRIGLLILSLAMNGVSYYFPSLIDPNGVTCW
jgi:hypothetical protein